MDILHIASDIWPIIISLVLFVAWNVRIESKVLHLDNKLKEIEAEAEKLETKLWSRLDSIHTMFAEISTKLTRVEVIIEERTRDGHL